MVLATHAPPYFLIKSHRLLFASSFLLSSPTPTTSRPLSFATSAARLLLRVKHRRFATMAADSPSALVSPPAHVVGPWYSVPELRLRDHRFTVPLDYSSVDRGVSPKLTVFAREVVGGSILLPASSVETYIGNGESRFIFPDYEPVQFTILCNVGKEDQLLPYLLYLQGGPGFECPRPSEASGWLQKACEEFRVVLMDQRGTGLSTPLTPSSMSQLGSAEKVVEYLKHFRADNIVKDAEFIRVRLVPDAGPWTILGQSYGGFCAVTYLSFAPRGLKQVLLTGGIPLVADHCTADTVYRACSEQVIQQNAKYYERFPHDVEVVREVVKYLANAEGGGVPLPSGGILTPKGLQTLGLSGLGSSSGFERLHYLFERVWDPIIVPGSKKQISDYFLNGFDNWLDFGTNPLYALMHESIYCQGASSRWSAHRIRGEYDDKFNAIRSIEEGRPVFFTGEMVFPWMFDEVFALKKYKDVAHLLAEKQDWPPLYDPAVLSCNKVPVAAAVYYDDMYVNFKLAMETASKIAGIRLWITNEYMHSGLRDAGGQVLDHLLGMLNGKKPLF